jgi:L-fuconolactonase
MSVAVDAHQHFWRLARGDYGWLTPALGPIHRDFEEADLTPILARHGVARTILVQAAPTEAETDYMLALGRRADFVAGVVGWVDFEAGDAAERIAARAAEPLLKGLRPMLQDLADDAWLLRGDLAPAFAAMRAHGLRFDALVKPRHLPVLIRFVERHPGLRVVIDHGAKPEIARWSPGDEDFRRWAEALKTLASLGCYAKLSGLVTEAPQGWTVEALKPYVETLLACFGTERLMWGSDWPVAILGGGYDAWREASVTLTAHLSEAERDALFGGAAMRFYGLDGADQDSRSPPR